MKLSTLLFCLLLSAPAAASAVAPLPRVQTQSAEKNEARLAVVNVFAYGADGALQQSGQGFFLNERGEVAASYALLKNAARVEIVDAKGRKARLLRVTGANSSYDLIRFTTDAAKQPGYLQAAEVPAEKGARLMLVNYSTNKKSAPRAVNVETTEPYNDLRYYTISAGNEAANLGCPLVNEAGNVVAVVQRAAKADAANACAIDARFAYRLSIGATAALNADLRELKLPVAIPAGLREALTYIYMLPAADTLQRATALHDFTVAHPQNAEGRVALAGFEAERRNFAAAESAFAEALRCAEAPAEGASADSAHFGADAVRYAMSNLFYRSAYLHAVDSSNAAANPSWTFERALAEADAAHQSRPQTLYLLQKANCLFALKRHAEAAETYKNIVADPAFATPENYYAAARALELSAADSSAVIALLDSAVAAMPANPAPDLAEIRLQRAQRLINAGRYREAVADFNAYEQIIGPKNLSHLFYYKRHLCEVEARMYQQALDDLHTAIATTSSPLPYRLEEAYLLLRVAEFERALNAAEALLKDLPESPDCYKIIGIAQGSLGRSSLALAALKKAKALGDTTVDEFIAKYGK